ncbi:hypothetical protein [Pseudodesulfovibrio sp.]|uniref:hypothetical protein n=1 Tax=unclassified Pseudodesulfovibrio TaxID=2661612 RepID=UPI003B00DCFA
MKKLMMLFAALALVLSASAAFAGFSTSPSSDKDVNIHFVNDTDEMRVVVLTVEFSQGTEKEEILVVPHSYLDAYYSQAMSADFKFDVLITDKGGEALSEAKLSFSKGKFTPEAIGEGITCEKTAPDRVVLTLKR